MIRKPVRLNCQTTAQVGEAVEQLLWQGLYGSSRAAVVERLVCEALQAKAREGVIKLEELQEKESL